MPVLKSTSYLDKVQDLLIVDGTFTNDDGKTQEYKSIQIVVMSDGKKTTLPLSGGSAVKPAALQLSLKGADTPDFDLNIDDEN